MMTQTGWIMGLLAMGLCLVVGPRGAMAQMEQTEGQLAIELNAAQSTSDGCTFSFLVINGLPEAIDALVLEAVQFDTDGRVERLTLFDFGALPVARPRVRQFVLPGATCDAFGAVLINGAPTCDGADGTALACEDALDLRSRVDIELLG